MHGTARAGRQMQLDWSGQVQVVACVSEARRASRIQYVVRARAISKGMHALVW
jgi:hypothetical protein